MLSGAKPGSKDTIKEKKNINKDQTTKIKMKEVIILNGAVLQ